MEDLHDSNEAARLIMQPQTDQVSTTLLRAHKEEGAFSTYVDISSTTNILHEENNGFRESVDDVDEKPGDEVHVKDDKATFNSLDPNEELFCVIIPACEESMQPMPTGCAGNTLVMESTCSGEVFSSLLSESEESGSPLTISSGLANDRVDSSTSSHDTVNRVQLPSTLADTNIPVFEDQDFETNLDEYSQTTNDLINVPESKMEKGVVPNENGKAKVDQTFYAIMVPHISDISSSDEANKRVTNLEHGFECPAQKEDEPCGLNSPQAAQTACGNFGMVHVCAHEGNSHSVTLAEESTSFEESNEQSLISLLTHNDEVPDDLQSISLTRACSCKDSSSVVHKKEEFCNPVQNYPNAFLQGLEEEHFETPFDDDADQNVPVQHVTSGYEVMFNSNDQNTSLSVQVSKPNIYPVEAKSEINPYQEFQVPSENGTTLCDCEELISPSNQAFTSPCLVYEKFTDKVDQEVTTLGPSFTFPMPPSPLPNNTVSSNPLADLNRPSEVQCVEHQRSSSPQGSSSPNEENISLVHCDKDIPSDHQGLSCLVAVCEENTSPVQSGHHQSEMQTPLPDCKELTNLLVIPNSQSHQVPSTDEVLCSPCESVVHEGLNDSVSKDRNSDTCDHEDHTTLSGFQELSNLLASEEETIPLTTVIDNSVSQSLVNEELIIAVPVDRENGTSDGTMPDGEDSFHSSDLSPCKELNSVVSSGHVLVGASLFPSAETLSSSCPLHEETANLSPANIIDDISHSPESFVSPSNISTPVNRLNTFQPTTESHFFLDCFKANNEGSKVCVAKVRQLYKDIDAGHFGLNNHSSISFENFVQRHAAVCESRAIDICEFLSQKYSVVHCQHENGITGIAEEVGKDIFAFTQAVKEDVAPKLTTTEVCNDVRNIVIHGCLESQSTKDLNASEDDYYVTPSPFPSTARRPCLLKNSENYQSTPPISQSVTVQSLHNCSLQQLKSSSGDRDERIPSKVRIIERTDTEVHSSDQAVPDCEASSLTSQPKSDTEPFYQDTIRDCEASRPTYQPRLDNESFYQDAVLLRRNDVKPHNLSQNSVFSWDRVDIIHDTPVEKDSNSEGSLFKVLPLKTCMKPRRVGLSKRQKLPPLHHKVRKPSIQPSTESGTTCAIEI